MNSVFKHQTIASPLLVSRVEYITDTSAESVYRYTISENAHFHYTCIVAPGLISKNINFSFILERNSFLRVELLVAHTNANIAIDCIMSGESSHATVNGVYILHQSNNVKIITLQHHKSAHTNSTLKIRGVIDDKAQVLYSGMVHVEKEARCSVSSQENKTITLSNNAKVVSIPSLEVLTNDVHCFHGSAIGRFDQDQFFYALSRGINQAAIKRLLLESFFNDLFINKELFDFLKRLL